MARSRCCFLSSFVSPAPGGAPAGPSDAWGGLEAASGALTLGRGTARRGEAARGGDASCGSLSLRAETTAGVRVRRGQIYHARAGRLSTKFGGCLWIRSNGMKGKLNMRNPAEFRSLISFSD